MNSSATRVLVALLLLGLAALLTMHWSGDGGGEVPLQPGGESPQTPSLHDAEPADASSATANASARPVDDAVPSVDADPERVDVGSGRTPSLVMRLLQSGKPLHGVRAKLKVLLPREAAGEVIQAVSSEDGRVRFYTDFETSLCFLSLEGDAVPAGVEKRRVTIRAGETVDLGDIELPVAGRCRGRVVDGLGHPIAGVWVLVGTGKSYSRVFDWETTDPAALDSNHGVVTGANGRFELPSILPGSFKLNFESPRFQPLQRSGDLKSGGVAELGDVALRPGDPIRGRVRLPNGDPVAAVAVVPRADGGLRPRLAAMTDSSGRFEILSGGVWVRRLAVSSPDYVLYEPYNIESPDELHSIVVHPAEALRGQILGANASPVTVEFRMVSRPHPPHWSDLVYEEFPASAEDGRFEVERFVPGDWELKVRAGGRVVLEDYEFEWSLGADPLVVEVPQFRPEPLTIVVQDELGEPVPGARVFVHENTEDRAYRWSGPRWVQTTFAHKNDALLHGDAVDESGRIETEVQILEDTSRTGFVVGARSAGHLAGGIQVDLEQAKQPIVVILRRAGALDGTLTDASDLRHCRLYVMMKSLAAVPEGESEHSEAWLAVDAAGRFRADDCAPGRYRLRVLREDQSDEEDRSKRAPDPVPVLAPSLGIGADGYGGSESVDIEILPTETTKVEFDVSAAAVVQGVVTAGGQPMQGVQVFGIPAPKPGGVPADWLKERRGRHFGRRPIGMGEFGHFDSSHAGDYSPRQVTGSDGKFRFLFGGPGTYWLYARAPKSVVPAQPVRVVVTRLGEVLTHDISLPSAVITGTLDPSLMVASQRGVVPKVDVWLFRASTAHVDPWISQSQFTPVMANPSPMPLSADLTRTRVKVGDGTFRIPFVPPGDWVLRVCKLRNRSLLSRVVHVADGDGLVDLGVLKTADAVDFEMVIDVPSAATEAADESDRFHQSSDWSSFRAHLVQAGVGQGVFVQGAAIKAGKVSFSGVQPGDYRVELVHGVFGGSRVDGEPLGVSVDVSVDRDGKVVPASVDWSGVEVKTR